MDDMSSVSPSTQRSTASPNGATSLAAPNVAMAPLGSHGATVPQALKQGSTVHTTFVPVYIHTAKCDLCDKRNKNVLQRCSTCCQQVCNICMYTASKNKGKHWLDRDDQTWIDHQVASTGSAADRRSKRRARRTATTSVVDGSRIGKSTAQRTLRRTAGRRTAVVAAAVVREAAPARAGRDKMNSPEASASGASIDEEPTPNRLPCSPVLERTPPMDEDALFVTEAEQPSGRQDGSVDVSSSPTAVAHRTPLPEVRSSRTAQGHQLMLSSSRPLKRASKPKTRSV
jgi:hypothetical protein